MRILKHRETTTTTRQIITTFVEWEARLLYPVELDIKEDLSYELKIAIDNPPIDIDEWLNYFKKEGLYLTKEKRRTGFIKIKRLPTRSSTSI